MSIQFDDIFSNLFKTLELKPNNGGGICAWLIFACSTFPVQTYLIIISDRFKHQTEINKQRTTPTLATLLSLLLSTAPPFPWLFWHDNWILNQGAPLCVRLSVPSHNNTHEQTDRKLQARLHGVIAEQKDPHTWINTTVSPFVSSNNVK